MNLFQSLCFKNKLLHDLYYSNNRFLITIKKFIRTNIWKRKEIDIDDCFSDIIKITNDTDLDIFPMFGTLLCYYRDGNVSKTDDYDFGVFNLYENLFLIISKFKESGMVLKSISLVDELNPQLVEISFNYRGVQVDIFEIKNAHGQSIHKCPNFRTEKPKILFHSSGLSQVTFKSYFKVAYPEIKLIRSMRNLSVLPKDPESIFEIHYGSDWKIPKVNNFIDYDKYEFINKPSYIIRGDESALLRYLKQLTST